MINEEWVSLPIALLTCFVYFATMWVFHRRRHIFPLNGRHFALAALCGLSQTVWNLSFVLSLVIFSEFPQKLALFHVCFYAAFLAYACYYSYTYFMYSVELNLVESRRSGLLLSTARVSPIHCTTATAGLTSHEISAVSNKLATNNQVVPIELSRPLAPISEESAISEIIARVEAGRQQAFSMISWYRSRFSPWAWYLVATFTVLYPIYYFIIVYFILVSEQTTSNKLSQYGLNTTLVVYIGIVGFKMRKLNENFGVKTGAKRAALCAIFFFVFGYVNPFKSVIAYYIPTMLANLLSMFFNLTLPVIHSFGFCKSTSCSQSDHYTLDYFLVDRLAQQSFESFLVTEFSVENLHFYLVVEKFKSTFNRISKSRQLEFLLTIYQNFISLDGIHAVNIPSSIASVVKQKVQTIKDRSRTIISENEISPHILDDAQKEIYNLMVRDSFPRYLKSHTYRSFLKEEAQGHMFTAATTLPV